MTRIFGITGHRPETLSPAAQARIPDLQNDIFRFISSQGLDTTWISGGARGVDTWAAEAAIVAGASFRLYLPFPVDVQARYWPDVDHDRLKSLAERAEIVTTVREDYHVSAYHVRDKAIVDDCHELFAVWDGRKKGGTWETVRYARQKGRRIYIMNPETGLVGVE